jgi:hypothetical protein
MEGWPLLWLGLTRSKGAGGGLRWWLWVAQEEEKNEGFGGIFGHRREKMN